MTLKPDYKIRGTTCDIDLFAPFYIADVSVSATEPDAEKSTNTLLVFKPVSRQVTAIISAPDLGTAQAAVQASFGIGNVRELIVSDHVRDLQTPENTLLVIAHPNKTVETHGLPDFLARHMLDTGRGNRQPFRLALGGH